MSLATARSSLFFFSRCCNNSAFSLALKSFSTNPNPPLDLDPSLQALLKDVDVSLSRAKTRPLLPQRELEVFPIKDTENNTLSLDDGHLDHAQRKSPAAHFGSQQVGAIILPPQLQTSINLLISGARYAPQPTSGTHLCFKSPIEYNCIVMQNASFMTMI